MQSLRDKHVVRFTVSAATKLYTFQKSSSTPNIVSNKLINLYGRHVSMNNGR